MFVLFLLLEFFYCYRASFLEGLHHRVTRLFRRRQDIFCSIFMIEASVGRWDTGGGGKSLSCHLFTLQPFAKVPVIYFEGKKEKSQYGLLILFLRHAMIIRGVYPLRYHQSTCGNLPIRDDFSLVNKQRYCI